MPVFQCFGAVWAHSRGAFRGASASILETRFSQMVTCPMVVLVRPQGTLLAYSLSHETKSNGLSCAWPRSGQLARFLHSLTTLPVAFKVIFISAVVKRRYYITAFICSQCLLAFSLQITVEPSCVLSDREPICFCSARNYSKEIRPWCHTSVRHGTSQKCYLCVFSCLLAWLPVYLNSELIIMASLGVLWVFQ